MNICVFGAASNNIDEKYIKEVEKLGEEIAKRGHTLVFGAGKHGLMGAVARGAHRFGGKVIGVIPKFFKESEIEVIYNESDELIYTETMSERKDIMEEKADAFITVPGGIGTFEEFFEVLTLKQLARHAKPMAIFNINGYYEKLKELLDVSIYSGFVKEACRELCFYSKDIGEILTYVENDERTLRDVHELKNG